MCIDRLEHVESILQQHTNTLRIMQGKLVSPRSIDGVQHQSVPIVPTQIDGSSPNRYIDPTRLATPPNLAAQLSVTSSKTLNLTATTFNPESNRTNSPQSTQSMPTFGTSGATGSPIQGAISGSPPAPTRKSYGEMASSNYGLMSSDNPPSTRDKRNHRTLRKDSQSQSDVTTSSVRLVTMTIKQNRKLVYLMGIKNPKHQRTWIDTKKRNVKKSFMVLPTR